MRATPARAWKAQPDLPALAAVRTALEEALGMKFEAEKGEHFFRSTLVQTLFYGVFSAWVLWHKEKPQRKDDFDWKSAAWTLHVPMIKALFEQVATPTKLGPLGLGGSARLDRRRAQPRGPRRVLREISGNPRRPVFLRTVPRSLRPRTAQATGRVVHAAGDCAVSGRPRGRRAARGTGHSRRPGRPARVRARPLLRHRRVSCRGAASTLQQTLERRKRRRRAGGTYDQGSRARTCLRI